jgi:hypothetical protein
MHFQWVMGFESRGLKCKGSYELAFLHWGLLVYGSNLLIKKLPTLGPYTRPIHRVLLRSYGGQRLFVIKVSLQPV